MAKERANAKVKGRMRKKNVFLKKNTRFSQNVPLFLKMFHVSQNVPLFSEKVSKKIKHSQTFSANPEHFQTNLKHSQNILGQPKKCPKKTKKQ